MTFKTTLQSVAMSLLAVALAIVFAAGAVGAQTTTSTTTGTSTATTTSTTTPGIPETGTGSMANILILGASAAFALGGMAYLARRGVTQ